MITDLSKVMRPPCYSPGSGTKFFIIKSFCEMDLHKAIKYKVWSSTKRGNMVLDQAYSEVQSLNKH